jgi:hypothetical protein
MELSYVIGSLIVSLFLLWVETDYQRHVEPPTCQQAEECPQPEEDRE